MTEWNLLSKHEKLKLEVEKTIANIFNDFFSKYYKIIKYSWIESWKN